MQIEVRKADLLDFEGDGILLPTVSDGSMQLGMAARVLDIVGKEIETEVMSHAPIAVGAALVTDAPNTRVRHIIHVPLVEDPTMRVGVENIRRSTRAGLLGAARYQLERVCIPGVGYGEQGVPPDEAARAIIDEVNAFKGAHPTFVCLVDEDEEMVEAFRMQVGSK